VTLPLYIFHRLVWHECGHRHAPGDVTHLVTVKLADPYEQSVLLSAICNGCNNYGGEWKFIRPKGIDP
jgi:hypothetical protein